MINKKATSCELRAARLRLEARSSQLVAFLIATLILQSCFVNTKKQPGDIVIPYPFANDSFLVRINDLSANAKPADTIHFVYYADESLKSGKEMESLIAANKAELLKRNYVFVGVAHFGAYRPRRRRDLIPPSIITDNGYKGVSDNYGQADSFYNFLRDTIMPLAEKKRTEQVIERSFIGHSLGGLFATYLFVTDTLFTNLYALSPALWIDEYHLLNYESKQQATIKLRAKNLWISCGGNETINRIKEGVNRVEDSLNKRKYPAVQYKIKVYEGKNHNSSVAPAMNDIFNDWVKNEN